MQFFPGASYYSDELSYNNSKVLAGTVSGKDLIFTSKSDA